MSVENYKPYTKEEVCKFLDFLFLTYFSNGNLRMADSVQSIYRYFNINPLSERMLESLENLEKKGKKSNDKS